MGKNNSLPHDCDNGLRKQVMAELLRQRQSRQTDLNSFKDEEVS